MVWIILLTFFLLIICWLLLAPLALRIDTRIPRASLHWLSIGKASVIYENDHWLLQVSVLLFKKQWELEKLFFKKRKNKRIKEIKKKGNKRKISLRKLMGIVKTFRVIKWEIAIDTGDCVQNAWLYPLNFVPYPGDHLHVNFIDENYLVMEIRNAPWKLAYAFMK